MRQKIFIQLPQIAYTGLPTYRAYGDLNFMRLPYHYKEHFSDFNIFYYLCPVKILIKIDGF